MVAATRIIGQALDYSRVIPAITKRVNTTNLDSLARMFNFFRCRRLFQKERFEIGFVKGSQEFRRHAFRCPTRQTFPGGIERTWHIFSQRVIVIGLTCNSMLV